MKFPCFLLLILCAVFQAVAQDYRVVYSPSLKLEVWIDELKDSDPASWCSSELPLRIVAAGDTQPEILNDFLPRVGNLLEKQCQRIASVRWLMNDSQGNPLARGHALKADNWALHVDAEVGEAPAAVAVSPAETLSPPADTTPWLQFSLIEGCHFRGYWGEESHSGALFVPSTPAAKCVNDGWLSGPAQITQIDRDIVRNQNIVFLQGFQVVGLNSSVADSNLKITTVNNQRMVLNDSRSPDSWMILPYHAAVNGWQSNGTVAVQLAQAEAGDETDLQQRLDSVRKAWAPWLADDNAITILLIDALQPQLKDPAAGAWRIIK